MNNITVIEKQFNYLEDVVYNGLNPSGISVGGGGGSESDLYYSKVQLDAGQLDNRYYIKAEVNALTWDWSDLTSGVPTTIRDPLFKDLI
jgi:hypothetical protein